MKSTPVQIATDAFERIIGDNPNLTMYPVREAGYYDAEMNIPAQDGLKFPMHLILKDGRRLFLVVDPFWGEWFPCTKSRRVKEYRKAVNGLLRGEYRIEIISRNGNAYKASLQAPKKGGWKTVADWGRLHLPFGRKSVSYIQNTDS